MSSQNSVILIIICPQFTEHKTDWQGVSLQIDPLIHRHTLLKTLLTRLVKDFNDQC